jgi:Putative prokaryotic signal transducing protein
MRTEWEPGKLATAAIFYSLHEADVAKGLLDSCGVDCFLCDEHMHRVHPLAVDVVGGVRLQVAEADLELAKELLKDYTPAPEPSGPDPIE